jgi:competence protein ComEA
MQGFDIDDILIRFRLPLIILMTGLILFGGGIFLAKVGNPLSATKLEVLEMGETGASEDLTVEISGEVTNPGVYRLAENSRIEDLLIASGGFSTDADQGWTDKYLNRAAKLSDGQKIYIPKAGEQSGGGSAKVFGGDQSISSNFSPDSNAKININSATLSQLDTIPGIGPVYAQNIIEQRPYSTIEELVQKGAIKQGLFEKIKDYISVY